MSNAACIVIPIYNHKDAISATVANLVVHGLPLYVVDDGSDEATQQVLAALAQQYAGQLTLLRLPVNGGKGAAVMAGLRAARAAGYTHALQIDADGQHDAADVPRFLEASHANPRAVILGRPVYDASVPKSRLYGRYLTHVWVWIETLSFTIQDSMCGFRLYPLDIACALIDKVKLGTRMDFDIEILVRLHWRRVEFVAIADARDLCDRRRVPLRRAVGQRADQPHSYAARCRDAGAAALLLHKVTPHTPLRTTTPPAPPKKATT
jgi:glycosyltransferase involved in cell wall biosynthesis